MRTKKEKELEEEEHYMNTCYRDWDDCIDDRSDVDVD